MAISNYCSQLGDACNNIGEYKLGSEAFETAFRAEMSPACGTPRRFAPLLCGLSGRCCRREGRC